MRIAVTGASGFIGTEVLEALQAAGETDIIGITRDVSADGTAGKLCRWAASDYSPESLSRVLEGVETVIHLAAVRGTAGSITDYQINETITENLLQAMAAAGTKHIIFASTIAVYSDTAKIPWKESDPLTPKTLYGITKAACEHLCMYYAAASDFHCTILRIAQVVGDGERRRNMMKVFIDRAAAGEGLTVMGRSVAARQYIYSRDLADLICRLALAKAGQSRVINAGMTESYTNLAAAEAVNEVFDNPGGLVYDDAEPETIEPSAMEVRLLTEEVGFIPRDMRMALADIKQRLRFS